jgi:hypothetical protein
VLRDEPAMPTQDRLGCHEERRPPFAWQHAAQPGERDPVAVLELGPANLASQYLELFAQHDDLDVLRAVTPAAQHEQLDDPTEQLISDRHVLQPCDPQQFTANDQLRRPTGFPAPTGWECLHSAG